MTEIQICSLSSVVNCSKILKVTLICIFVIHSITLRHYLLDSDTSRQIQGIGFLRKSADQGHELALELLGACYRTGRGITSSNESEIRKFLGMSPGERAARRAAQELFASLSNGEEYVTVEQLEKRMREIYKLQKKKKKSSSADDALKEDEQVSIKGDHDQYGSSSQSPARIASSSSANRSRADDNNQISEANLVTAGLNYSNGRMPALSSALTLSVPHPQSLDHVPCFHRPFFHPILFFSLLYHRFIRMFASFPSEVITRFQILFLLAAYTLLSTDNILIFLPTVIYFISLIVMVISSFKMLKSKHEFIDFRIWSGLFLSYDEHVNADDSENRFLKNTMNKSYLWFFVSFGTNLMIYPFISDQWLPHSEITTLAFLLTFVTMFSFMYTSSRTPDILVLLSFACNMLAKYPYEMDSVVTNKWRFLDLKIPAFTTYVIGSGIEFSMNCRGLLYLMIPVLMFFIAKRRKWHGIYLFLIPHCVTLSWMQIAIIGSESSTTFGMARSALGLAGIFLFLPLFGIISIVIPVFAAVEWLSLTDSSNKIFASVSTFIIAITGSCLMAVSSRTGKYVTVVQVLLCILASCFLFRPYMMGNDENLYSSYLQTTSADQKVAEVLEHVDGGLSFDLFQKYCQSPAHSNKINTQIRCAHLDGTEIHWEGVVSGAGITKVRNWRRNLIRNLPDTIASFIECYFGSPIEAQCFAGESCEIKDFLEDQKQRCSLDNWNL